MRLQAKISLRGKNSPVRKPSRCLFQQLHETLVVENGGSSYSRLPGIPEKKIV
jgi:hypothetical protein